MKKIKEVNQNTIISIKLKWLNIIERVAERSLDMGDFSQSWDGDDDDYYSSNRLSEVNECISLMHKEINNYKLKVKYKNLVANGWALRRLGYMRYYICPKYAKLGELEIKAIWKTLKAEIDYIPKRNN